MPYSQGDVRAFETQGAAATPEWWNVVGKFRAAAADLEAKYAQLQQLASYVSTRPQFRSQYNALMARVKVLRSTISGILAKVNGAISFFKSIGSAVGLGELGILPVIAIAAIAAALAAIAKWTLDAVTFMKRIEEQRRLESAGVEPGRAAEIVSKQAEAGSLFGGVTGKIIPLALLAGGVLIALRFIKR